MVRYAFLAFLLGIGSTLLVSANVVRKDRQLSITPAELQGLVTVRTPDDVQALRARLTKLVFDGPLPTSVPSAQQAQPPFPEAYAAKRLAIGSHFIESARPNGKLAIYHSGHKEAVLADGAPTIRAMLSAGFDVVAISMPAEPHGRFATQASPLRPFLEPVALSLNHAMAQKPYNEVVMAGLSGGGWTTVVYAALDSRIHRSYPIAGSWPAYLRALRDNSVGDYEQQLPGLGVGYLDLYLLASSEGREQLQIFNRADPCCFSGELPLTYEAYLRNEAKRLGGSFGMVIDANNQHTLSPGLARLLWR